eukprot:GHVL01033899.1.p2 GENE.GHVL01033899.1~~GHVL01033899.1.p2  ORF type:complete len:219 (-),score=57.97 GHVL01033899.1:972-1628(-)
MLTFSQYLKKISKKKSFIRNFQTEISKSNFFYYFSFEENKKKDRFKLIKNEIFEPFQKPTIIDSMIDEDINTPAIIHEPPPWSTPWGPPRDDSKEIIEPPCSDSKNISEPSTHRDSKEIDEPPPWGDSKEIDNPPTHRDSKIIDEPSPWGDSRKDGLLLHRSIMTTFKRKHFKIVKDKKKFRVKKASKKKKLPKVKKRWRNFKNPPKICYGYIVRAER